MEARARRIAAVGLLLLVATAGVGLALTGGVFTTGTITLEATDGPQVDVVTSNESQILLDGPDGANTVEVIHEDGEIVFSSSAPTQATVQSGDITGTYTVVTSIDASNADLTINPEDKRPVTVGGGITSVEFRNATVNDGATDFRYSADSTASVTVNGLPADTMLLAVDADTGAVLDQTTTDSSGTATWSNLDSGDHNVQIAEGRDPSVDDSSASPSGGETVTDTPVELSINVSDADFGVAQGDNVTVTFEGKYQGDASFTTIDTQTISSNQTVTTKWTPSTLGVQEWRVTAEDEYGGTTTSETFTFETPNTITIRNETAPSEIIKDPVNTTVRFFGEEQIFERTSSDGTINMTGLPDEEFIVDVEASSDYHARTVFVESIYDQQTVYLLNKNESSVESRFTLDDPTGQYGPETVLFIEKPITRNGTTTYETVHADEFGAEGVTATLEDGQRYRLRVRSESGTTQVIGPYRATKSESVSVSPGAPTIPIGESSEEWSANAELLNDTLEYRYEDPEQLTDSVTVYIHERGNKSNQLTPNETYYDVGNVSAQVALTANESEKQWVVNFDIERDGESFTTSVIARNQADLVPEISREWRLITGIGLLMLSAGAFSMLNSSVGAVVVSIQGGVLWWTGWLEGATIGAAVIIAIFISVLMHIYSASGP